MENVNFDFRYLFFGTTINSHRCDDLLLVNETWIKSNVNNLYLPKMLIFRLILLFLLLFQFSQNLKITTCGVRIPVPQSSLYYISIYFGKKKVFKAPPAAVRFLFSLVFSKSVALIIEYHILMVNFFSSHDDLDEYDEREIPLSY